MSEQKDDKKQIINNENKIELNKKNDYHRQLYIRPGNININNYIEEKEKLKAEKEKLIVEDKTVKEGVYYLVWYKVYDLDNDNEKIEYGLVGIFNSHYLAKEASELAKTKLENEYNTEHFSVRVLVKYDELYLNSFINI